MAWRAVLRDLISYAAVLLVLGVVVFVAWLGRHPDAAWIEDAEDWSVLGPAARWFRGRYVELPAPPPADGVSADAEEDDLVYVIGGGIAEGRERGSMPGFIPVPDRGGTPPMGNDPLPVLPVAARTAQASELDLARENLGRPLVEGDLGGYGLLTDLTTADLRDLEPLLADIESAYRRRYGVAPVGEPAETLVVFRQEGRYRSFQRGWQRIEKIQAHGHASTGLAALYRGDRENTGFRSTLLHEITHLLNRRALGPALPAWLEEGIADDLSQSRIGADGTLEPGTILWQRRREEIEGGYREEVRGALASLQLLTRRFRDSRLLSLQDLLGLDSDRFLGDEISFNYAASAFFVRYLLDPAVPARAASFREFLRATSTGVPPTPERLLATLGRSWNELDAGYRLFLVRQATSAGLGADLASPAAERAPDRR